MSHYSASRKAERLFALDIRSLALWRILAAILLLADVAWRTRNGDDVYALLSDWGVWPGAHATQWNPYILSLHFVSGTPAFQGLMLLLSATCSLCLLVGYRTRLCSFFAWLLLTSLHNRNQMLQDSGDEYLRLLLLVSAFLPLGACFSVDAALEARPCGDDRPQKRSGRSWRAIRWTFASGWTCAFLVQVMALYVVTAILKTGDVWWNGQAVYYALSLDMYVTSLGLFLRQFPAFLGLLTWSTLIFEWVGPWLLVFPIQTELVRLAAVVSFCLLHLGFGSCLHLGLFMWIPQAAMCALLPSLFWEAVLERLRTPARRGLHIYYDDEASLLVRLLGTFLLLPETRMTQLAAGAEPNVGPVPPELDLRVLVEDDNVERQPASGAGLVAVTYRGDVVRGAAALLCILEHSPFLFFLPRLVGLGRRLLAHRPFRWSSRCWTRLVVALGRCLAARPAGQPARGQKNSRRAYSGWRQQWLAVLFIAFTLNWNAGLAPGQPYLDSSLVQITANVLRLDQHWGMFAPFPFVEDGWWVMPGWLQDGTRIDMVKYLLADGLRPPVELVAVDDYEFFAKPARIAEVYPTQRWAKLLENMRTPDAELLRLGLGRYICREWNANVLAAEDGPRWRLLTFEMIFMAEVTLPDQRTAPVERIKLWKHVC